MEQQGRALTWCQALQGGDKGETDLLPANDLVPVRSSSLTGSTQASSGSGGASGAPGRAGGP